MKAMWPVRVDGDIKEAFEKAAARQCVDVSSLRRSAYDEYIANHPDIFFVEGAKTFTHYDQNHTAEVAQ